MKNDQSVGAESGESWHQPYALDKNLASHVLPIALSRLPIYANHFHFPVFTALSTSHLISTNLSVLAPARSYHTLQYFYHCHHKR